MELSCHKSEFFMASSSPPTLLPFLTIYYSAVNQLGSSSIANRVYGKRDSSLSAAATFASVHV